MSFDATETYVLTCGCPLCAGGFAADDGSLSGGASASKPVFTLSQIQTQLRTQWGGDQEGKTWTWLGTTNVTYSIDANVTGVSESSGLVGMTALMEDRARLAFELWDDVIAISLTESPGNANADITFNYSSNTDGGGTYAWWSGYASGGNYGISRAYIWLNSGWSTHKSDASMSLGGYGFITYLHEIGHSLGLSHPGTYNAGSGGSITYANSAEYAQDSRRYTVMSYFDANEAESFVDHYGASGDWKYATSPLLHDIAALQAAYGADNTTRTGNTTYGFNSTADRAVFDFTKNTDPIVVIWDAGGIDTLDCSGYSTNQLINLTAGSYSNVGSLTYNVAIAFNCTIENAVGGTGDDTIIGNSANNRVFAGDGADTVSGGDGDDILVAHSTAGLFLQQADSLSGGNGNDTLYGDAFDTLSGGAGFDVLQVINSYNMNVDLIVTGLEYVVSEFGNDVYTAASGSTAVEVYGGGGNDTIIGGSANDRLWGGVGNDTLIGNDGNDVLVGDLGADSLTGGDGNDRLDIDPTDTFIDGGNGFDIAYIATGSGMTLNMAATNLEWVADVANGNDIIDASGMTAGVQIYGGGGVDSLTGGSGNDYIFGGSGDDTLTGNAGNDRLVGEAGNDILYGGSSADIFVWTIGGDTDTVMSWQDGSDKLGFHQVPGLDDAGDLTIVSSGANAELYFGAAKLFILVGAASQIDGGDFLFT